MRVALIVGIVALILVLIFIIQNAHAVSISFLGAHLHLSLAVALLLAAVAGALVMAAAGTARITQLRQIMRRDRRNVQRRLISRSLVRRSVAVMGSCEIRYFASVQWTVDLGWTSMPHSVGRQPYDDTIEWRAAA